MRSSIDSGRTQITAVRIGRGTSLNERQLLLVSVTVESAPVKWAREFPAHRVVVPISCTKG